jgi:putative PIN family toxin of toxin-antitoxin system
MTVVLDCNVLVICLSSRSPYHSIYQALIKGKFRIVVTTEIVLEYEEIIQRKYGVPTANAFISLLSELPNVKYITSYYQWLLIDKDPDDNKYVDCVVAGRAEYLVTEDQHFNVLKSIAFPQITTLSVDSFQQLLLSITS